MTEPSRPNPQDTPGPSTPEEMIFDDNLREFATQVGFLCALESSGKLPPGDTYKRIQKLWKQLKVSKKNLRIGKDTP
ncbi:hypothetical protein OT109_18840 [Phycisphaeraceae bacterium D3-23]